MTMRTPQPDDSPQREVEGPWGRYCSSTEWRDGGAPSFVVEIADRLLERAQMRRTPRGSETDGFAVGWHVTTGWFVARFPVGAPPERALKVWSET